MARYQFKRAENIDDPKKVGAFIVAALANHAGKANVVKIVIGPSPGGSTEGWDSQSLARLADVEWASFPNLTHLYLWSIAALGSLKPLPAGLQCLDVRGCTGLQGLPKLPPSIESIVTDGCASMKSVALIPRRLDRLEDLSMAGCPQLVDTVANNFLQKSPNLRRINFSGSPVEPELGAWPDLIEVAIFNGCGLLENLPAGRYPKALRRLEVAGTAIRHVEPLSPSLDYVDLTRLANGLGDTALWPTDPQAPRPHPRTLLLYRSGLLVPPTFAQGVDHEDNVAPKVCGYFDDVGLVGNGTSRRCKVLFLGNGGAGKTTLSRALAGEPPKHDLGTTHGIRFALTKQGDVDRHFWDFGGQAIYHNAHRLFMQSGAVFMVLWNPRAAAARHMPVGEYADRPRPIPYWIEMIRRECPGARIAVVCNVPRTDEEKAAADAGGWLADTELAGYRLAYATAMGGVADPPPLLLCDAEDTATVDAQVSRWLLSTITDVVRVQGTVVPIHWEIAEAMVAGWLETAKQADENGQPDPRPMLSVSEFRNELHCAVVHAIQNDASGRLSKLRDVWNDGAFLTAERIERVLGFLTDSGMLFWSTEYLGDKVIVGQKWALDRVYAVLERRSDTPERKLVFERLSDDPTFTDSDLATLVWNRLGCDADQQQLLLSFMQRMGLCFPLRTAEDAWTGEARYLSVQHLKPDSEARLAAQFKAAFAASNPAEQTSAVPSLHQTRWEATLAWLGQTYGGDARYASDAFFLERNNDGQAILVRCAIAETGIGGTITVWVASDSQDAEKDRETCATVLNAVVKECSADSTAKERRENQAVPPGGDVDEVRQVFISYSWNPPPADGSGFFSGTDFVQQEYEQPVIELCQELKGLLGPKVILWDRDYIGPGQRISDFVKQAKEGHLFVVCHSPRYWRRPYCMYELYQAYDACGQQLGLSYETHFCFVGFADCRCLDDVDEMRPHIAAWQNREPEVSQAFEQGLGMSKDELVNRVLILLNYDLGKITDVAGNVLPRSRGFGNRSPERISSVPSQQSSNAIKIAGWIRERLERNAIRRDRQVTTDD